MNISNKTKCFNYKVTGYNMFSEAFEKRPSFNFTVRISAYTVNKFVAKALEYIYSLNFKFVCISMYPLVMNPCSHDFLVTSVVCS